MRNLLSTVRTELVTSFHVTLLHFIDETDFSNIRRKVALDLTKIGIVADEGYLDEGILALKQYYALAILDPKNMHAISDVVDPFWHAHILHTEEYIDFCNRLIGRYLHHDPLDHEKLQAVGMVDRLYRYTVGCYEQFFSYVNPIFFPVELPVYRLVCKHMLVTSEDIRQYGLLPENPDMQPEAFLQ